MNNICRHGAMGLVFAISSTLWAGEIPGSGGKLDYGTDDLPIPLPIAHNVTPPRTGTLLAAAAAAEKIPFKKMQLLVELGESRMVEGVPTLVASLGDENAGCRANAAVGIAIAGADDTRNEGARKALLADAQLPARLKALGADPDAHVASAALQAQISLQGPGSPAIDAALKSSVAQVLAVAIEAASQPQQAKIIVQRFDSIPVGLRPRAIAALGRSGDTSHAELLIALANGGDVQQAVAACQSLATLAIADAAPHLRRLTDASHPTLRREALRAFGKCAKEGRLELATARLTDADVTVRQAAVEVVGANLTAGAVASIVPHLATDYEPLYRATRTALISAKDDATREMCIQAAGKLLHDASPRRQEDGSYVLGMYRSAHELERQVELLDFSVEKPDWKLIEQVARSVGQIAQQAPRAAIVKLVNARSELIVAQTNSSPAVNAAIIAGGQMGATEILPACDRVLAEDPMRSDTNARLAAAFAIGVAGTPSSPGVDRLFNVLNSPMDAGKIEALKAIGNLKIPGAADRIQSFPTSESYVLQWLIQWATARINGVPAQHPVTMITWSARSSISDVERFQ